MKASLVKLLTVIGLCLALTGCGIVSGTVSAATSAVSTVASVTSTVVSKAVDVVT